MIKLTVRLGLYTWIACTLFLFFSFTAFLPNLTVENAFLARVFESVKYGFLYLPQFISWLLGLTWGVLEPFYTDMVGDLGYEPFALPSAGPSVPSAPNTPTIRFPNLGLVALSMVYVVIGFSIYQFILLFFVMLFGGKVTWVKPGLPFVMNARSKLFYWVFALGHALFWIFVGFEIHWLLGLIWIIPLFLVIRFPLLAGLPLWFAEKILGLHPRMLTSIPQLIVDAVRPQPQIADDTHAPGAGDKSRRSGPWGAKAESFAWHEHEEPEPKTQGIKHPPVGRDETYKDDCELFEIDPDPAAFDAALLRTQYRQAMLKNHPDKRGSKRLAQMLTQAYERILSYHGMTR